jgi:hypothetical protein
MSSARLCGKKGVKADNAGYSGKRNLKLFSYDLLNMQRKISVNALHHMEYLYQASFLALVIRCKLPDALYELFLRAGAAYRVILRRAHFLSPLPL